MDAALRKDRSVIGDHNNDGSTGNEIWKSDGTESGTMLVKDIQEGSNGSGNGPMVAFGDALFFQAQDGVHGIEIWKTDGTEGGTVLVKDINPTNNSQPNQFTVAGNNLFFMASDGTGRALWKTDGTEMGTMLVKDIHPGFLPASSPTNLTNVGGTLYFRANDGSGYELWKSDGTEAGTVKVQPGVSIGNDATFINVGGTLYFPANDGTSGYELWKSDGTEMGTVRVKDIYPGDQGSNPDEMSLVQGALYFTANDGSHGVELWKSDGTEVGTVLVEDLTGDIGSAEPHNIVQVEDKLLLTATNATFGTELWSCALCPIPGDFDHNGTLDTNDVDALVAAIAGALHPLGFDLDNDQLVTTTDLATWLQLAGAANLPSGNAYLPADANLDGIVDGLDYIAWNTNKFSALATWSGGDFNANGFVDGQDFIIWNEHKFQSSDGLRFVAAPHATSARQEALDPLTAPRNEDADDVTRRQFQPPAPFAVRPLDSAIAAGRRTHKLLRGDSHNDAFARLSDECLKDCSNAWSTPMVRELLI